METKLTPLAMPCKNGYPNSIHRDWENTPIKKLEWFINQIGSMVFASLSSYQGPIEVHDQDQAKQLYNNQFEGYTFLSLEDKMKQALAEMRHDPLEGHQEPEIGKVYLLAIYVNRKLQESTAVVYTGLSHNLKWYIFNFVNGSDSAGNSCHLLKVGYFPGYQNSTNKEAVILEQYLLIS